MILKLIQLWFVSCTHGFSYSIVSWHKLMPYKSAASQKETMLWFRAHWWPCHAASQCSVQVKAGLTCAVSQQCKPTMKLHLWTYMLLSLSYNQSPGMLVLSLSSLSLAAPEFKENHSWKLMAVFMCSWLIPDSLTTSLMPSVMTAKNTSLFS